jgi:6-phosphogluconolactonase (cycloisomerase 2 family)
LPGFSKFYVLCLLAAIPVCAFGATDRIWIGASDSGIYTGELNASTGTLGELRRVVDGVEAHYIVKHPSLPIIYAAVRTEGPSRIVAYRAAANGDLSQFDELGTRPHGVSHINISQDGRHL